MIDFGLAARVSFGTTELRANRIIGTENFIAPEQLLQFVNSPATDIWQCGVTLFVLIFHTFPFFTRQEVMTIPQPYVISKATSDKLSDGGVDLFSKIFTRPPNVRISIPSILNHSWIRGKFIF